MKITLVLVIVLMLSGCISHQSYPKAWSAIDKNCPNLTGVYHNQRAQLSSNKSTSLIQLFALNKIKSDTVNVTHADGAIQLVVKDQQGQSHQSVYTQKSGFIGCKDGFWVVEKSVMHNKEGALGKEWKRFLLSKNGQGLIVKKEQGAFGMLFFVPVVGSESDWYLFKQK